MAYYRTVNIDFWQDVKIVDNFTPEDKYFMLYLLTNPKTNLIGCYELSKRTAATETGYNKETVERLLNRFKDVHQVIDYDPATKEVLIFNWRKYNWTKSDKLHKALVKGIDKIKNQEFKRFLTDSLENIDAVYIPYLYPMDTSVTVTDTVTDTDIYKRIIEHLNRKAEKNFKPEIRRTRDLIKARMKEGFTEEDFYKVIDATVREWKSNKVMRPYLRPETLFGTKFESYLNQSQDGEDEFRPGEIIDLPFLRGDEDE